MTAGEIAGRGDAVELGRAERVGATEMGQGALDAGRMLFGEARDVGKEELDKAKEITTDWINRVT